MQCHLCASQGHHWTKCPLFGKPEEFIRAFAPQPLAGAEVPMKATRPSLAPSFEHIFGQDKEQALADIMDDPSTPPEERMLALEVLIGTKHLNKLDAQDQQMVDGMAQRYLFGYGVPRPPEQAPEPRKPRETDRADGEDSYSSINYDEDRDPQNIPT